MLTSERFDDKFMQTHEIVKLHRRDASIDTRDDLLGNGHRVDMLSVQAVTQPRDTSGDLVELDTLLTTV
jgi:hypothetical protein